MSIGYCRKERLGGNPKWRPGINPRNEGVPWLRFADLRKLYKMWAAQVMSDFQVSKSMGQSTPTTAYRHYEMQMQSAQQSLSTLPLPGNAELLLAAST